MKNEVSVGGEQKIGLPMPEKLTDWEIEPSVQDLKNDLQSAKDSHDTHVTKVDKWNDLRNCTGSAKITKKTGRSSVQPKLIRRQAEWRYSALSEPFLSSHKMFKVRPMTFEDKMSARQNEMLLNYQFRTKINRVKFIDQYIRTGVDEGSIIVRLGWSRQTRNVQKEVPIFQYEEIVTKEQAQVFEQAMMMKKQNPRGYKEQAPLEMQAACDYYEETGIPTVASIIGSEVLVDEEIIENKPTLQILDSRNVYIDPAAEGDLDKAKYVIITFETTKADLIKDGRYKNLDAVNWSGNKVLSEPDYYTQTPENYETRDELRRPVVVYEYWGLQDIDGSESLVPIVASWIGDVMVRCELNPFPDEKPPLVVVPYLPVKRALLGEPDAEILEDNQKILGAITRGMIDLLGRSANAQQGMAKGFLDVTNKRRFDKGDDYEFNPGAGTPQTAIHQHTYPEIPASAMNMIAMQNNEAEALSGVKAFHGGLSGEAYGDVATGIRGVLDASSKREMNILRRLAQGIKEIGIKIMRMNAVFLTEEEVVRVTNEEFVTIRRDELLGNFDVDVDINTPEIDQAQAQDLGFMLQTMGPNMDPMMSRLILAEIAELKRMPALAQAIRAYKPKPDPIVEQAKKLEVLKLQKEVEKLDSEIAWNLSRAGAAKADSDLKTLDFVEQETGTKHARDLEKQKAQGQANQNLEVTKALLDKLKPEERRPDIEAAIGYNAVSQGPERGF